MTLEFRAGNLGPSAIAWTSYSVAMVSISSYEIDRGKLHPKFHCQSPRGVVGASISLSIAITTNMSSGYPDILVGNLLTWLQPAPNYHVMTKKDTKQIEGDRI